MAYTDIRLNQKLIGALSSALYTPAMELIRLAGIPHSTWYNIKADPAILTVQQLLGIANGMHVPVKRFFSSGNVDVVGRRDDYVIEDYVPCRYDAEAMQRAFDERPDATWRRAAGIVGMAPSRLKGSMMSMTRTPVTRFLQICRTFDIDPFSILIDPTPEPKQRKPKAAKARPDETQADGIDSLREDVRRLSRTVEEITRKYEDLICEQKALSKRLDDHIRGGRVVIIADDAPEPDPD